MTLGAEAVPGRVGGGVAEDVEDSGGGGVDVGRGGGGEDAVLEGHQHGG